MNQHAALSRRVTAIATVLALLLPPVGPLGSPMAVQPRSAEAAGGDLTGHWRFDESGGTAVDDVGGANGTLANVDRIGGVRHAAVQTRAQAGSAVVFPDPVGKFGTADFSIAFWWRTSDTSRIYDVLGNRNQGSHGNFLAVRQTGNHELGNGRITFELDEDGIGNNYVGLQGPTGLNDGQWHHFVATRQGTTARLYVDGILRASGNSAGVTNLTGSGTPFKIGRSYHEFPDVVLGIDDLRIYNRALSDMEVGGLIDATPPVITATVGGTQGNNGWYTSDVTVAWSVADPQSGIASSSGCANSSVTNDTSGTTFTCSATNGVDLSATSSVTIKRDATAPGITINSPMGQRYLLNQSVMANYACADGGSGVAACAGTVPSGSPLATGAVGAYSLRVDAADLAGNAATRSVAYTVGYRVCVLHDETRAVRSGASVPIRIQLCDAVGANVSSAAIAVTALSVIRVSDDASSEVMDTGNANPDNGFRYDASLGGTGGYMFNLSTKGLAMGTYRLAFSAFGDPGTLGATFQVR